MTAAARRIDLSPADWFLDTTRPRPALPKPESPPLDQKAAVARLKQAKKRAHNWDWVPAQIPAAPSPEEARFWLSAMLAVTESSTPAAVAKELAPLPETSPLPDLLARLADAYYGWSEESAKILAALYGPAGWLAVCLGLADLVKDGPWRRQVAALLAVSTLGKGFLAGVRPYLSEEEAEALRGEARPRLTASWPEPHLMLASVLGLHEELAAHVSTWPDGSLKEPRMNFLLTDMPFAVLGLGPGPLVLSELNRLQLPLSSDLHVRRLLAVAGFDALEFLKRQILTSGNKNHADAMIGALDVVKAPELPALMLELTLEGKGAGAARRWLDEHPEQAIAASIPLAGERGKLGDAALAALRDLHAAGKGETIESALAGTEGEAATRVRSLLKRAGPVHALIADADLPPWFVASRPAPGKGKLPVWCAGALAPIVVGAGRLSPEAAASVLV